MTAQHSQAEMFLLKVFGMHHLDSRKAGEIGDIERHDALNVAGPPSR
jgi:hypothetical protein